MKINILFEIADTPKGGGNQFLRGLKEAFKKKGVYSEIEDADVVLFNSYQFIDKVLKVRKKYPDKFFVHRIDGPIRLYNTMEDRRDSVTNATNKYIADATIYQSEWSKKANLEMGLEPNSYEAVITNGVDDTVFNRTGKKAFSENGRTKIIASSWSTNINKGFEVYKYLDDTLDFSKYEMIFVGNSPVQFQNIKSFGPKDSKGLAETLKQQDIYITASKKETCSNSLIEALACGLPVVCYNDGGNPEILNGAGFLFEHQEEIPGLLEQVVEQYDGLQKKIQIHNIMETAQVYIDFFDKILKSSNGARKKLSLKGIWDIKAALWRWKHSGR